MINHIPAGFQAGTPLGWAVGAVTIGVIFAANVFAFWWRRRKR
jgi:hypothetical protein